MIREAQRRDMEELLHLSKKEHKRLELQLPWDEESSELQLRNLMFIKNAQLFVWDQNGTIEGVAGGPLVPWPYDTNIVMLQEYITAGKHLNNLRNTLYDWSKENGACGVIKLCVDSSSGHRTTYFKGETCHQPRQ